LEDPQPARRAAESTITDITVQIFFMFFFFPFYHYTFPAFISSSVN